MPKQIPERVGQVWTFTLVLDGVPELTQEVEDALFQSGCSDALVGSRDGVVFLDFDRESNFFEDAVRTAIASVESAGIGARVVRLEPDELVTMAEIARRSHRSRESIRQLVAGQRGPGNFPPPIANLSQKSPIWRWYEVRRWLEALEQQSVLTTEEEPEGTVPPVDALTAVINATLEVRRYFPTRARALQLFTSFLDPQPDEPKAGKSRSKKASAATKK